MEWSIYLQLKGVNLIKILINNPIFSTCMEGVELIKPILTYKDMTVRRVWQTDDKGNRYQRKKKIYFDRYLVNKGILYTGYLSRIKDYANKRGYELEITESDENKLINSISHGSHILHGITLRDDQEDTVKRVLETRRGIFLATMSYGKSIVAASVLKAFETQNSLILCMRKSILSQLKDDFIKFGFKSVGMLDKNNPKKFKITLSTPQSLIKLDLIDHVDTWNVIIVDEAHIGIGFGTQYEKILSSLVAPIRLGLTATLPQEDSQKIAMEGLLGPVIKKVDFQEGNQLGILTKAKLKLIPVPKCRNLDGLSKYQDIYKSGIVEYRIRNQIIIEEAKKLNDSDKSCLIFVTHIDHGNNLVDLGNVYGLNPIYVKGDTEDEEREKVKKYLHEKKYMCVISTSIFREGISIHSLDSLILGFGGKSSTALAQAFGRMLRQWEGKDEAIVIDFLDKGRYLSEHCIERLELWKELKLFN